MRILLVEDDRVIASLLRRGLQSARYSVDVAADGDRGLEMALEGDYALVILDVMLPGQDGWSICAALRAQHNATPILMLTALDAPDDRVRGLELGADDYLSKPFHFPELLARVHSLVYRNQTHRTRLIRIADLCLDTTTGRVTRSGAEIRLNRREFGLLAALAGNEGRLLSPRSLRAQLAEEDNAANNLQLDMETLRDKIDGAYEPKLIHVAGTIGYVLQEPKPAPASAAA